MVVFQEVSRIPTWDCGFLELRQSDHQLPGPLLSCPLSPWWLILAGQPVLGSVLVVSTHPPFRNYGGHCAIGNLQK